MDDGYWAAAESLRQRWRAVYDALEGRLSINDDGQGMKINEQR